MCTYKDRNKDDTQWLLQLIKALFLTPGSSSMLRTANTTVFIA